jgi:site-specific DNA recombinase
MTWYRRSLSYHDTPRPRVPWQGTRRVRRGVLTTAGRALFDRVQAVLKAHDRAGEKQRIHNHYLKGSIFCAGCGSHLCFTQAKSTYQYFYCLGRQQRRTDCRMPTCPPPMLRTPSSGTTGPSPCPITPRQRPRRPARRTRPATQARPTRTHSGQDPRHRIGPRTSSPGSGHRGRLHPRRPGPRRTLALLGRCDEVYRLGGPQVRRFANQCFFTKLLIAPQDDTPTVTKATLRQPCATLHAEDFQRRMIHNTTSLGQDLLDRGSK